MTPINQHSTQFIARIKQWKSSVYKLLVNSEKTALFSNLFPAKLPTVNFVLITLFILMLTISTQAQKKDSTRVSEIKIAVMARPQQEGKIMLRWGVTSAKAWRKLNTYGYELRRYTISINKQAISRPIVKKLGVFKPKPLTDWMKIIDKNNNAAVMAQSIYGEQFDITGVDKLSAIVNLAEEQEQRFTWGLYAADQDYETAQMAGLAYIDFDVKPNEKYVYKVTSLVPEKELKIMDGGAFTSLQEYEPLPKPIDLAAVFMNAKTMLSWNYTLYNQLYNSYFIERSEDGINFKRLNDLPLTSLNNSDKTDTKRMFYMDSIANDITYHYRILGKTPFGELGPVSDAVSGKGDKPLEFVPHITTKNYLDDKRIILEWEFVEEGNPYISSFELNRSDQVNGTYKTVIKNIPPTARKIQYDDLQPTNYLTITAIGKNGSRRTSFPALVQPVDSIPPAKPINFRGAIDSLGIVTLKWDANKEPDIFGYRIFRGNNKNEEFSQITVSPHQGTVYLDSISVKNLNAKVYYQLIAVDQRFNMSESSEILELKKPDFIKPIPPIFKAYKIEESKVRLSWTNSTSEDVIKHEIFRRENDNADWVLVHTEGSKQLVISNEKLVISNEKLVISNEQLAVSGKQGAKPPTTTWTDEKVVENKQYSYMIVAVDDSGLRSAPSPLLTVIIPKMTMPPAIQGLDSYIDKNNGFIELFWREYKENNVVEITIYKGIKDKAVSLWRNVLPTVKRVIDDSVKPNNEYSYLLRAVFKDGSMSKVAKLNVKY